MHYRKDIQILRGIAVLLVVLYHLEVFGLSSGFLGVDVFFVISGYLMALMYNPAKKIEFLSKRAKRLLPAYFVVVLVTIVASIVLTIPNEYTQVANQTFFAATFSSNIGFWLETSYFSKAAFEPLLHLWSLGVEIQFYILMPLLYWIFKRVKFSYWFFLLGSLVSCFVVVGVSPKTSFFWLPFRLWEFLIGYGVATFISKKRDGQSRDLGWLGVIFLIVLVCIPLITVDGTATNFVQGHPGIVALVICLATAIVLVTGLPKRVESFPLATILEKLGRYSYSIYLVHFPVIVLFLYQPFSGTILKTTNFGQLLVLVVIIACLSWLLYHFVENPLRADRKTLPVVSALFVAVAIICPLGIVIQKSTISDKEMLIYQAWTDRAEYRCGKVQRMLDPTTITCEITGNLPNPTHRILFVGDSHADAIKTTFASVAESKNIAVRFMVENLPLKGGIDPKGLINEALARKVDSIVLHYSPRGINASTVEQLDMLAKQNGIPISFILPVPVWPESVPMALWKNLKRNESLPTSTRLDYESLNRDLIDGLNKIDDKNFRIYPVVDLFCTQVCKMVDDTGKPLYFDEGHLTLTGSELMRGVIEHVVSDLSAQ